MKKYLIAVVTATLIGLGIAPAAFAHDGERQTMSHQSVHHRHHHHRHHHRHHHSHFHGQNRF